MPAPTGFQPLPGSERPPIPGAKRIGPVDGGDHVGFTILLHSRHGSPALHDFDHWQNTPPGKRKFLSVEEFTSTYGAAEEDLRSVVGFLRSRGLEVTEADAGRRRILVEGTAAKINSAFGIKLSLYRTPRRYAPRPVKGREREAHEVAEHEHRGFEGPVHLPSEIAGLVRAVIGLDNRRLGGPTGVGTGDPAGAASLLPTAVGQLYNFPNTGAAGETIGLFAAADEGAAFLPADVNLFIASLPAGFNTPPNLNAIGLTVGLTTYSNDTTIITSGLSNGATQETTQDVQTSAAISQGANINVYMTENSEQGWEAFLNRAIFPQPGDNPPSVLSASWVLDLSDDGAGNPSTSGTFSNIVSGYLQSAATRGITSLIAIGDWGASNQITDGHCHVGYPNSDPWNIACGGTIIGSVSATTPPTFQEFAWSDANTGAGFDLGIYDATGGGVSAIFPVPPYQAAAGVLPISKNDGNSRRGVPDVAGMVGMTGFVINGGGYGFTGTSCVAPLYAGLIAVINRFLGHSVGFINPTLYTYGPEICNDITFGNNDYGPPIPPLPPATPDSPFYTTGIGWDPCTGWGSIRGIRLLAALAPAPMIETAIVSGGDFGNVCVSSFADQILTINNSGFSELLISNITAAPADFEAPSVASYPLAVSPGSSIDVVIRFKPQSAGVKLGTITIFSNDLFGPHTISVTGTGQTATLALAIADTGNFGNACVGSFKDENLVLNNSGKCALTIWDITSSTADFLAPEVLAYPMLIGPGNSLSIPIRFQPSSFGAKFGTITVLSSDPAGPKLIGVSGNAPSGKIVVTGSTWFGGVKACCREERVITISNMGDCKLHVISVAFKRKNRHWNLVSNPFPETLPSGACLSVIIRYKATERCPRPCELVITSDDPITPVKTLELCAYTIWSDCCSKCCDECSKGGCEKRHDGCCQKCCDDCDDDDEEDS
jgi:hypothetical protein